MGLLLVVVSIIVFLLWLMFLFLGIFVDGSFGWEWYLGVRDVVEMGEGRKVMSCLVGKIKRGLRVEFWGCFVGRLVEVDLVRLEYKLVGSREEE